MFFIFLVPLWFVGLWLVIEGACEIALYSGSDYEPRVWTEADHAIQNKADAERATVDVNTYALLRKLAKSHGIKGETYRIWTEHDLRCR